MRLLNFTEIHRKQFLSGLVRLIIIIIFSFKNNFVSVYEYYNFINTQHILQSKYEFVEIEPFIFITIISFCGNFDRYKSIGFFFFFLNNYNEP